MTVQYSKQSTPSIAKIHPFYSTFVFQITSISQRIWQAKKVQQYSQVRYVHLYQILTPYLEDVSIEEEDETQSKSPVTSNSKVAFVGMSNWAVDATNMNSGIVVIHDDPDQESLVETTK